jgi:hypothetical protein
MHTPIEDTRPMRCARAKFQEKPMPLISLIIILVAIGVVMWAINTYVPMSPGMKNLLNIVVVIAVVLWLLRVFGVLGSLGAVTV